MLAELSSTLQRIAGWWSRWTLAQRFAMLTAILIAGGAIIQGAVLIGVASNIVSGLEAERIQQRLDKAANHFAARVDEFRKVPLILAGTPPIERIVALSSGEKPEVGETLDIWRARLGIIFRSIALANPALVQARLIGAADGGREIVRVNRTGNRIEIVHKARLQRRAQRSYFRETARLRRGQIYISAVEPDVENEVVQRPLRPAIHAATPIFTKSGVFFGVIVVNAAADAWLSDIADVSGVSDRWLAANQYGDYFFRTDGGPIFGPIDGKRSAFQRDWPKLSRVFESGAPRSLNKRKGDHYVSADRVNYDPDDTSRFVVIATDSDPNAVFADTWTLISVGGAIAVTMALIGALIAFFISRPLRALMTAARQIAAGHIDVNSLFRSIKGADIGELGEALRIMNDAVETRDTSLQRSEAYLQAVIDNTIDGLVTIDRHGVIRRYNRGCEQIFGYTISEAIGQNVGLLIPAAEARRHDAYIERYCQTGEARFIGKRREVTGRHKDGHLIDIELAVAEIRVGDEVLFSGIVSDITERKKVERMQTEFVSTITHELRTPLTSIMGSLGLLRSGALGCLPQKAESMITLAYDNVTRLTNLINDILDIDQIEAGALILRVQPENLRYLIEKAAQELAAYTARYQVAIAIDEIPNDIAVETDSDRFHQVMANLISNAAKFSPKGAMITIAAKMTDETVRVSVTDRGLGIAPAFRPHVFERFAQADSSDARERGGTGLGLSIAKALVERMGGRIGFETEIGAGSTFYFDLPAYRTDPEQPAADAARDAGAPLAERHIA